MEKTKFTEADFNQLFQIAEAAIKKREDKRTPPPSTVPKAHGAPIDWNFVIVALILPFIVNILSDVASDALQSLVRMTPDMLRRIMRDKPLREDNPDFDAAIQKAKGILVDMGFSEQDAQIIIKQIQKGAQKILDESRKTQRKHRKRKRLKIK